MTVKISLDKAKKEKLFYFVVTGIIFRGQDSKCLILKRSSQEIAHPGLWGPVGGKLEWDDLKEKEINRWNFDIPNWTGAIERLLFREASEECGLKVEDPRYLSSVAYLRTDNVPVICAQFALKLKAGEVKIAPEFEDFAWVNPEEIKNYETIAGIKEQVAQATQIYSP